MPHTYQIQPKSRKRGYRSLFSGVVVIGLGAGIEKMHLTRGEIM
jgi:hypothetical protein